MRRPLLAQMLLSAVFAALCADNAAAHPSLAGRARGLLTGANLYSVRKDAYPISTHAREFWSLHRRFGVLRVSDGRLILLARNDALLRQLINDLSAYSGRGGSVSYVNVQGIPGTGVDVSPIVTPLML